MFTSKDLSSNGCREITSKEFSLNQRFLISIEEASFRPSNQAKIRRKGFESSQLRTEGNSTIMTSWASKLERGSWKYNKWLHQTLEVASNLGCLFSYSSGLVNDVLFKYLFIMILYTK